MAIKTIILKLFLSLIFIITYAYVLYLIAKIAFPIGDW